MSDANDLARLPTGTVAFLVCDVVATERDFADDPDARTRATKQLLDAVGQAVQARGGIGVQSGENGRFVAAFARASDGVMAALEAQRAAHAMATPAQIRMAVGTGEAIVSRDGSYFGLAVAHAGHLCDLAHGGQVLVSATAREVAIDRLDDPVTLVDLGRHRLRDLTRPERIFQVAEPTLPCEFPSLRSLDIHPNNLPIQLTSFIGRADEIVRAEKLLVDNRLVTIAGVGGAGKTRLAQHVGARLIDRYPDGVWWIELADRRDAESLAMTMAAAMGIQGSVGNEAEVVVAERLADRELLLILDNCEHVLDPAVRLTTELLQRAPHVDLLATSREPLGVPGEVIWQIPQLTVPDGSTRDPADLITYEAVELFVDRAQRVRPNFRLRDENAQAVAEVVRRLDGIPLALELAASRCRSLTPAQILSGVTESLNVLTSAGRSGPARHHTLAASMQWSHQLLTAEEQVLLRRLAVFSGGCTLTDAEQVVVDDTLPAESVLDALDGLVAQSLVQLDDTHVDGRYRLLETVRQFGVERLVERDEFELFTTRHADHFLALSREFGPGIFDHRVVTSFARLAPELSNLSAALSTLDRTERWDDSVALIYDSMLGWHVLAAAEAENHLTKALAHSDELDSITRARAWVVRSLMRTNTGDYAGALVDAQAAAAQDDDPVASARAATSLGSAIGVVDIEAGDALLQQMIEQIDPEVSPFDHTAAKWGRAFFNMCWGNATVGHEVAEDALRAIRAFDNALLNSFALAGWAWGECLRGEYRRARDLVAEADAELASVAAAAGIDSDRLIRSWSGGVQLETARALVREATEHLPDQLERVSRLTRVGRAEGSILMHVLLGTIEARHLHMTGDARRAASELDRLIDASSSVGATYYASITLASAAECARQTGESDRALGYVARMEALGPRYRTPYAWIRGCFTRARIAAATGDPSTADELAREALVAAYESLYRPEVAVALAVLSRLAADRGNHTDAARLAGASQRLRDDIGLVCDFERVREDVDEGLDAARRATNDADVTRAYDEGYALDFDAAVAYAQRARGDRSRPRFGWDSITPTEHQVIAEIVAGRSNPEIAQSLLMSRETVKTHVSNIFAKLGVSSRAELAARATRQDLDRSP